MANGMRGSIARQIELSGEDRHQWHCIEGAGQSEVIRGLSQLNVFIGPNNSGKSRLLRHVLRQQTFNWIPDNETTREIERLQRVAQDMINSLPQNLPANELAEIKNAAKLNLSQLIAKPQESVKRFQRVEEGFSPASSEIPGRVFVRDWVQKIRFFLANHREMMVDRVPKNVARVYIPAIRSLHRYHGNNEENLLLRPFLATHFGNDGAKKCTLGLDEIEHKDPRVFNGVEMHDILHDLRLGGFEERRLLEQFEHHIGRRFFGGEAIALIPKRKSQILHIKVGREKERPIFELGDGLQQLIILTFPHFLFRDHPLMLFVEEPELYLHPGLQRDLIEAWLDPEFSPPKAGARQIFVATHSSQFIDLTLDQLPISVYRIKKRILDDSADSGDERTPFFEISLTANPEMGVLADLGVKNSSLLLTNATLWVEGITDRMYIRRLLHLIQGDDPKRMREDVHFSFVEYGGANVVHWSVLEDDEIIPKINVERLCGHLMLIADQDDGHRRKRHEKIREVLRERFVVLQSREIENMLGKEVLRRTISRLADGCKLPDTISEADYRSVPLGNWIDATIERLPNGSQRKFAAESGTINAKVEFARVACEEIKSEDDLTTEAKELANQIVKFVKDCQ